MCLWYHFYGYLFVIYNIVLYVCKKCIKQWTVCGGDWIPHWAISLWRGWLFGDDNIACGVDDIPCVGGDNIACGVDDIPCVIDNN